MRYLWILLLLTVASGCIDPVFAGRPGQRGRGGDGSAASQAADGTATSGRPWTVAFSGNDCDTTWTNWEASQGVGLVLSQAQVGQSCDQSTAPMSSAGLGLVNVNEGADLNGTCHNDSTAVGFPGFPDDTDFLVRLIVKPTFGSLVTVHDYLESTVNFFRVSLQAGGNDLLIALRRDNTGGSHQGQSVLNGLDGQWILLDLHYIDPAGSGPGQRPRWNIYANGTKTAGSEFSSDQDPMSADQQFSLGGSYTCPSEDTDAVLAWFSYDVNPTWFGDAAHAADCAALGLC